MGQVWRRVGCAGLRGLAHMLSCLNAASAARRQADEGRPRAGGRGKRAAEKGAARQAKRARLEAAQGKPRRQVRRRPRAHHAGRRVWHPGAARAGLARRACAL
jgi:hypothetical protein